MRRSREDRHETNKEVRREELGIKEPSNNAVIETMELLLMGVRNRLSKEVTVKLDFSVKKLDFSDKLEEGHSSTEHSSGKEMRVPRTVRWPE